MSALVIGAIVFACVFGGALFGMYLGTVLPKDHLNPDARDVIKVAMAMIATLAALVLGLLIASAKSSLDEKESELRSTAAQVVLLDRTMAEYGPETQEARDLLRQTTAARISQIWPEGNSTVTPSAIGRGSGIEAIQRKLLDLSPQTDAQRWLQSTALQISGTIAAARWSVLQQLGSSIQWPFIAIMVFWLAIIFASFGLFAPRNASVTAALFVAALSVAGSIFLILEMDQPYSGLIKISSAPLRTALEQLGRP
jgi:type II secretory pathway pseudopilin PulG